MTEASMMSDTEVPRQWRYTNGPYTFPNTQDEYPYFHLAMDTWYYTESPRLATVGTVYVGDGPLTGSQGAGTFVTHQVAAFCEAFGGLFRPVEEPGRVRPAEMSIVYEPVLGGTQSYSLPCPPPTAPERLLALRTRFDTMPHGGITSVFLPLDMRAMVRNDEGHLLDLWLPYAGLLWYQARYCMRDPSTASECTYILTPSAQRGIGQWTITLQCAVASLFQRSNAEMLTRVRAQWHTWLREHPIGVEGCSPGDDLEGDDWELSLVMTLAEVPTETPADNQEAYKRHAPALHTAITRWEKALGARFEWAIAR